MRKLGPPIKPIIQRILPEVNRKCFLNQTPGNSFNAFARKHKNLPSPSDLEVSKLQNLNLDLSSSYLEIFELPERDFHPKYNARKKKQENSPESITKTVVHERKAKETPTAKKSEESKLDNPTKKRGRKPKVHSLKEFTSPEEEPLEKTVDATPLKKRGRKPKKQESRSLNSIQECLSNKAVDKKKTKKNETTNAAGSKSNPKNEHSISTSENLTIDASISFEKSTTKNYESSKDELIKYIRKAHLKKRGSLLLENQMLDVKNRVDIVDNKLCDDAIERLRPSLEKYKGCDIIDLNPGVGLWSHKLHKELQPRNHILMEPHPSTYKSILDPLLESSDSTYRLVTDNGMNWTHLENVLSEEYLPHQHILDWKDPRSEQVNNTLLVTANLACNQPRRFLGFRSLGSVVIYQFLSAIRTRALFQKYGKVRMLLWINPYDARILPRNVANRKKSSLDAAVSCSHIELIIDTDETDHKKREKSLDIKRVVSVVEKMKEKGVRIPEGRETNILKAMRAGETGLEIEELSPKSLQKELQQMKEALSLGDLEKDSADDEDLDDLTIPDFLKKTPEYERMRELNRRHRRRIIKSYKLSDLADDFQKIQTLYRKSCLTKSATKVNAIKREIKESSDIFKENVAALSPNDAAELQYMCDNRRAYSQEPPCLFWDRREAEPLKSFENEFYPKKALSLLDLRPGFMPPSSQDPGYYDTLSFLTMQMCLVPAQSLNETLENLAPGARDWMLAECPSLTDPLRNGCPDLELFSARCITSEMLIEMCEAWLRWPFRLQRDELLHRLGSEAYYEQAD
ncbi:hypothetical protein GcM1_248075 [Golovinomyces cichoracearum]|uniref:Mitochondrial transcription factor 1 n=1 Tax=Golovinomyces cichoracearum TaxID=62708 RepID=A0A420ICS5_9PEZI|nr:hypothetical protein GcM1_248075 [Golovinomyces cichoracearum]